MAPIWGGGPVCMEADLGSRLGPTLHLRKGSPLAVRLLMMRFAECLKVSLAVLLLVSAVSAKADAATATCGTGGNCFAGRGFQAQGYEPRGAAANIEVRTAPLCTSGPDTDSTAWSMLAGDDNPYQYAQIGYIHKNYGSTPLRFFYERSQDPGQAFEQVLFGHPVYGNTPNFKAPRYPSDGRIHLLIDDAPPPGAACNDENLCVTTFDPLQAWSGTNAQWFAETLHPGDDVVGTSGNRTDFRQVQVKKANENWVNEDFNFGAPPSFCYYHAQEQTSDSFFRTWTNPVDHNC